MADEESRAKTAFATPTAQYQYKRMPMGLKGAAAVFAALMRKVLGPILENALSQAAPSNGIIKRERCAVVYLDDILIFSPSIEAHVRHLQWVFDLLRMANLKASVSKCEFAKRKVVFLGHLLDGERGTVAPSPRNVATVAAIPSPRNTREVDWCQLAVAACLAQRDDQGSEYAVQFASKALSGPQLNYSSADGEAFAAAWAIKHFRPYIYGVRFQLVTDSMAVRYLRTARAQDLHGKLARYALKLQAYDFEIIHKAGLRNGNVDGLSRLGHLISPEPEPIAAGTNGQVERLVGVLMAALRKVTSDHEDDWDERIYQIAYQS
ncbi:hypothetical protein GPECTOR_12g465 [Gonium pectorale]|uniref:Reverse transcriptase domain-containing protein n=1 Tax=Gonium pectorale TaxID=33097 RepID=A0A150GP37_GONPE|nr:hypothetical protein GPECTOR_12g465 [Gonium pectorale]|eukprot:KXZ51502.1 hypothetical protein GPECTOR_12g465 [Gonium pectorale]